MRAGDAFLKSDKGGTHLYIIISDPERNTDDPVIIVNITTHPPFNNDCACLLEPEHHEFIRYTSAVFYQGAATITKSTLEYLISRNTFKRKGKFEPEVLQMIREGALASKFTPRICKKILCKQGLA
jgi:hypothetical protein